MLGIKLNKRINRQGTAKPIFRILAVLPAMLAWTLLAFLLFMFDFSIATAQNYWEIILTLYIAILFSRIVIKGNVPRWLYLLIPYAWTWDKNENK